jgi:hypothetical protein
MRRASRPPDVHVEAGDQSAVNAQQLFGAGYTNSRRRHVAELVVSDMARLPLGGAVTTTKKEA